MLCGLTIGLTIAQQQVISTSQDVYKFNFRKQDNLQTTTSLQQENGCSSEAPLQPRQ